VVIVMTTCQIDRDIYLTRRQILCCTRPMTSSIADPEKIRTGHPAARTRRSSTKPIAAAAGALYVMAIVWATLRPVPWAVEGAEATLGVLNPAAWLDPTSWSEGRPLEVAVNIAMFVPIGVVASLLFRRRWAVAIPLALTLGIELAQIPLDRISHPRDLVANTLGGLLGVGAMALARRGWSGRAWARYGRVVHLAASLPDIRTLAERVEPGLPHALPARFDGREGRIQRSWQARSPSR
jgi:hypothetical protein